jgi:DNA-binding SARP family transcriptional activator
LPDEPYAEWAEALRSSTSAVHVGILRAIAALSTAAQDHLAASDAHRRLVDLDPYDEAAHLGLVAALRSLGARGQARVAYDRYVRSMEELGVPAEPDPGGHPGG